MKLKKNVGRLMVLAAASLCAVSCGDAQGGGSSTPVESATSVDVSNQFTVRFNACGGDKVASETVKEGSSISKAPTATRANYSFEGWCSQYDQVTEQGKEGTEVTFPFTPTGNCVLYARWTKAEAAHHDEDEIEEYVKSITASSVKNHVYFHYYRFNNVAASYDDWDVWCWPYRPTEGEGVRFNWKGTTPATDEKKVGPTGGAAIVDDFGGAVVDIDLTQTYDGGASEQGKKIGGTSVHFYEVDGNGTKTDRLDTQIGIQVVKSSTRAKPEGKFWTNDGGDLHIDLTDPNQAMAVDTTDGGKAWHIFSLQDKVADYQGSVISDMSDPFEGDKGEKVTRGKSMYSDVNFSQTAEKKATTGWKNSVGVGYQIQVACFADSDGDGFGDIYGITSKLDYLSKLGVKALWLTPVQRSDSYHGYDISDYTKVDAKFGSAKSPAGLANNGKVTEETAMADYEELITKAHAKGIKIVMDLVLNHTSVSNRWFIKSAQLDPSYRGFYQWGNHETDSGVTEAKCWFPYGEHPYSYYAKFGSSMPELNYQYKAARDAVNKMSVDWVKKGVDGFRLDAVKHIFMNDEVKKDSGDVIIEDKAAKGDYSSNLTKNLHFYRELNKAIKAENKDAFLVGENFDGNAYQVSPFYEAFDSMFDFWGYFNFTTAAAKSLGATGFGGRTWSTIFTESSAYNAGSNSYFKDKSYNWGFQSILRSYDDFREDKAMAGFFTSNHDIARVINRIAGTTGDMNGLTEQGNIDTGNYNKYRKAADLVKAIEILMPGCTWIYYGDEIGMTGNFPQGKDSTSDYADLWWRQPMKWTQGGKVGDNSMTTGFAITGSSASIKWDGVNASSTVVPANTQYGDNNSEYAKIAQVIAYKNANPALITGSVSDNGSDNTHMKFKNGNISVNADFNSSTLTVTGGSGSLNITF